MNCVERDAVINSTEKRIEQQDEQLVSAVLAGEPGAFAKLYATYSWRLYKTILAITRNPEDAEDALQETFLRAHLRLDTFEGRSSIYSWLTRIAINSALMVLRRRRTRPETLFDPHPDARTDTLGFEIRDSAPDPERICDLRQRKIKVLHAIRRLDGKLQAPIHMQVTLGSSVKEIGRALNISETAVKSRLHRARRRLLMGRDLKRSGPRHQSVDLHGRGGREHRVWRDSDSVTACLQSQAR
ncbi:MAG TPA: sigma-70 family RNA polymerase sigma factor [Acidobacteriaceae bacterium]|jgi:RNA polymerase sigma-70 factor (ECF subfamily)